MWKRMQDKSIKSVSKNVRICWKLNDKKPRNIFRRSLKIANN